ncbi:hypothetical protein V3C99_015518, partial [Haemonchus contortus]
RKQFQRAFTHNIAVHRGMVDVQPALTKIDELPAPTIEDIESGIVLDLSSNHEDDSKDDARSEAEHENGTEETVEMDNQKSLEGDQNEDVKNSTPEPQMSFENEPADKVPENILQPTIRNFYVSDSDTDGLAMLEKPVFQLSSHRKSRKKSSRKGSEQRKGQNGGSRREQESKAKYKESCKCQQIRNDPKLKTKVCTIL